MIVTHTHTQRQREKAGSMHREPDVGFDSGSPGSRPGPKAGTKLLGHPGIPQIIIYKGSVTVEETKLTCP